MDDLMEAGVCFKYPSTGTEPTIDSNYDHTMLDPFRTALDAINSCNDFTPKQKDHFCQYIDFFCRQRQKYPLESFGEINIIESSPTTDLYHICLRNVNLENSPSKIWINYRPSIFEPTVKKSIKKSLLNILTTSAQKLNNCLACVNSLIYRWDSRRFNNYLILFNGFLLGTLAFYASPERSQIFGKSPVLAVGGILILGTYYTSAGLLLGSFHPPYTQHLWNIMIMWSIKSMVSKISNGNK